jgi:hypothetical protein
MPFMPIDVRYNFKVTATSSMKGPRVSALTTAASESSIAAADPRGP